MPTQLMRFPTAVARDPAIDAWMRAHPTEFGAIAERWFEVMRACGDDVRELLHDGAPTACVGDAAFGYVNAFRAHASVAFFRGAELDDPQRLLEGTGKSMRHVKLAPGRDVDANALRKLIRTAYADMKRRVAAEAATERRATAAKQPASRVARAAKKSTSDAQVDASRLIDQRIAELDDWRGATLARIRKVIRQADPDVVEEWKWRGVPVWSHAGILCTGETYKSVVKMTFAKGASLDDPAGLFNSSLDGNTRRAIDVREGDRIDEKALKALIRAAVALNTSRTRR